MRPYAAKWRILAAALLLTAWGGGVGAKIHDREKAEMPAQDIQEGLTAHTPRLLAMDGVVGVGQGICDGAPCLKVMILKKTSELIKQIGADADGYRIEIIETGEIRALDQK